MTIDEILNCSADKLEAMSDDELREHFKPFLCVTRPEQANPGGADKKKQLSLKGYENSSDFKMKMAAAVTLAKQHGIDLKV